MGEISASQTIDIAASPDQVIGVLADYVDARPAILPEQYRDYKVISGGQGDGTVVHWILQATSKRQLLAVAHHDARRVDAVTHRQWRGPSAAATSRCPGIVLRTHSANRSAEVGYFSTRALRFASS